MKLKYTRKLQEQIRTSRWMMCSHPVRGEKEEGEGLEEAVDTVKSGNTLRREERESFRKLVQINIGLKRHKPRVIHGRSSR